MLRAVAASVLILAFSLPCRAADPTREMTPLEDLLFAEPAHRSEVAEHWAGVRNEPSEVRHYVSLGRILIREGYLNDAILLLRHATNAGLPDPQLYVLLSTALQSRGESDLPRVVELLEGALETYPEVADLHLNLGWAYDGQDHAEKAIAEFRKALALVPDATVALSSHLGLAGRLRKLGRLEESEEQMERAREIYPGIDEYVRDQEIARQMPLPQGRGREGGGGVHPSLSLRIRYLLEEIDSKSEDQP